MTGFKLGTSVDYIQTPEFTLTSKEGDCDCQAVLEYAMMMYYNRYIAENIYEAYIAQISFQSGPGHVAVFIPIQGGKLCILDPAGNYKTSQWGLIATKDVTAELDSYNSYWVRSGEPSITSIILYKIDTTNGSYTKVAEGNLASIVNFLS